MKKINFVLTALAVMMMLFVGCPNDETSSTTDTTIKQDTEQNGTIAQHTIALFPEENAFAATFTGRKPTSISFLISFGRNS